jgi:hypothetical protein
MRIKSSSFGFTSLQNQDTFTLFLYTSIHSITIISSTISSFVISNIGLCLQVMLKVNGITEQVCIRGSSRLGFLGHIHLPKEVTVG